MTESITSIYLNDKLVSEVNEINETDAASGAEEIFCFVPICNTTPMVLSEYSVTPFPHITFAKCAFKTVEGLESFKEQIKYVKICEPEIKK